MGSKDKNIGGNNWEFKKQHVPNQGIDTSNGFHEFVSPARTIIYAKRANAPEDIFYPIGVIQGFQHQEQKDIQHIFELGSDIPYLVPGRTQGSLSLSRALLHGADILNVLYGAVDAEGTLTNPNSWISSLRDITTPLTLMFSMFSGDTSQENTGEGKVYSRIFTGCLIQSKSENFGAGGTIVAENINIIYEHVDRVKIALG